MDTESEASAVAVTMSLLQMRLKELEEHRSQAQRDVEGYGVFLANRRADIERFNRETADLTRALEILQAA